MKKILFAAFLIITSNVFSETKIITECNDSVSYRVVDYLNNKNVESNFQVIRNDKNEITRLCDLKNKKDCFLFVKTFASSSYSQMNIYTSIDSSITSDYEVPTCKIKSIKESNLNSF